MSTGAWHPSRYDFEDNDSDRTTHYGRLTPRLAAVRAVAPHKEPTRKVGRARVLVVPMLDETAEVGGGRSTGRARFSALSLWRHAVAARDRSFTTAVRRSFASCGAGSLLRLPIRVYGEQSISVGRNVVIGEGSWLQTLGDGAIEIGDGCRVSGFLVLSAALSIVLEPDVLIARNVHILDHIHRFDRGDLPIHAQWITAPRQVRIGQGSWIGANVVILPGVTIGRGSVVGANSVVDRDVRDRVVVVGAPAREVRQLDAE